MRNLLFDLNTENTATESQYAIRDAMESLVASMVEKRGQVKVRLSPSHWTPVLVLSCARSDYGTVAGAHGTTLDMLRLFARCAAFRAGLSGIDVDLDASACTGDRSSGPKPKLVPRADWDAAGFEMLVQTFCSTVFGRCAVAMDALTPLRTKVVVALLEPLPDGVSGGHVEEALAKVLKVAGAMFGHLINVELANEAMAHGDRIQ